MTRDSKEACEMGSNGNEVRPGKCNARMMNLAVVKNSVKTGRKKKEAKTEQWV